MPRKPVNTAEAPGAIGTYSQAMACGKTVYLSGQIPLDPKTMALVGGGIEEQVHQVFRNLATVAKAAGGSLAHASKVTIYMTDLANFATAGADVLVAGSAVFKGGVSAYRCNIAAIRAAADRAHADSAA